MVLAVPRLKLARRTVALLASVSLVLLWAPAFVTSAAAATGWTALVFDQCQNGTGTATDCPESWTNGALNASHSHYHEDEVVPQRLVTEVDSAGQHVIQLEYLARDKTNHAYDSLATWNHTQTTADRCQDLLPAECVGGAPTSFAIPADPQAYDSTSVGPGLSLVTSDHQLPGQQMVMYGGTITGISVPTHDSPTSGVSDFATVLVTFTTAASNANVMLLFGGHLATRSGPRGWGIGHAAGDISGSPYHIMWTGFGPDADHIANVSSRDNQIQAGAILPPAGTQISTAATGNQVGGTIHDVATVTPSTAVGSVEFDLYADATCSSTPIFTDTEPLVGGTATSADYSTTAAGSYYWIAHFVPTDVTKFDPADGACGDAGETSTVTKLSPTITTQVSTATATVGQSTTVGDAATLSGGYQPSGSVLFTLYSNDTCTATAGVSGSGTISSGHASYSTTWTPPNAGTYYWQASYDGDANNEPYTSGCTDAHEQIVVGTVSPSITTQATPTSGTVGTSLTVGDSATFHGAVNPTGSVHFALYAENTCTTTAVVSGAGSIASGSASYSTTWTPPNAGTYYWQASYAGDANNEPYTSGCTDANEQIVIGSAAPQITTVASPSTATLGQSGTVGDTATFHGAVNPTGSVTFTLYSDSDCSTSTGVSGSGAISNGAAGFSASWTPSAAGTYYWQAHYDGDTNNQAFTTGCADANEQVTVAKARSSITTQVSHDTAQLGQASPVGDTATVSGYQPSGSVTFTLYADDACTSLTGVSGSGAISNGTASYSTSWTPTTAGTYYWQASYAGDANNNGFTSGCTEAHEQVTVAKADAGITTQTAVLTVPIGVSSSVGDTATVSGYQPSGPVTFTLYSDASCQTAVNGISGSGAISSGTASYSTSWTPTAAGTYYWQASYAGDANNNGFTSGCLDAHEQMTVPKASPGITTQADPTTATLGVAADVSDTATLTGAYQPTGTVSFTLYADDSCTTPTGVSGSSSVSAGRATYTTSWTPTAAGTYYWRAHYSGDSNNNQFTSGCTDDNEQITVPKAGPTISTQATPTTAVVGALTHVGDSATLSGAYQPTGQVGFTLYADSDCTESTGVSGTGGISGGSASYAQDWTPSQAGTYYWRASYAGDANNDGYTSGCLDANEQLTVSSVAPTITTDASPTTATLGVATTVGDTATFHGAVDPTGSVTFTLYSDSTCTTSTGVAGDGAISNGGASFTASWTPTAAGTYYWQASYAGDNNNDAFTTGCNDANEQVTVAKAGPSITTVANPSSTVVGTATTVGDTATLSGAFQPSGSVSFALYADSDCSVPTGVAGSGAISGTTAAYSTSWTPPDAGTYYWQASYAGDANNDAYTSGCLDAHEQLTVLKASPSISTSAEAVTALPEGTLHDTATLTGATGDATGQVTFTLYGPSDQADCSGEPVFTSVTSLVGGTSAVSDNFTPTQAGRYWWIASYSGDDNNHAVAGVCGATNETSLVTQAILGLNKSADPASGSTVQPGQTIDYSIAVPNTGDADALGATVVDTLPAHVTVVDGTISDGGVLDANAGTITWVIDVPAGTTKTLTYAVTVDQDAPQGSILHNLATLGELTSTTDHPVAEGGLGLTKAVSPTGSAQFGDTLTYTLVASASGTLDQHAAVVSDVVPEHTTYVSGSAACVGTPCTTAYDADTRTVTWALGDMAHGTTRTVSFQVTIDQPTPAADGGIPAETITNVGAVRSTETPTTPSNEVQTPVTAVLGVKVVRKPPVAVLPFTGLGVPVGPATALAAMLVVLGAALNRRPAHGRRH